MLDSERALADLEDELAQSDAAIAASFAALSKALGGGVSAWMRSLARARLDVSTVRRGGGIETSHGSIVPRFDV